MKRFQKEEGCMHRDLDCPLSKGNQANHPKFERPRAYLIYEYFYFTTYFVTNRHFDVTSRLFSGKLLLFVYLVC